MKVLGIHDGHNASACLLADGKVLGAVQEERFSRVKNHDIFPSRAIAHLLREAGIGPGDVDRIALNGRHLPRSRTREDLLRQFEESSDLVSRCRGLLRHSPVNSIYRRARRATRLRNLQRAGFEGRQAAFVDHHRAHAAAAYWGSPWREGPVLVLTCDAAGDDLSASASVWEAGRERQLVAVGEADSLGMVYSMVTFLTGMVPNEHEYKLMGLAPYAHAGEVERVCAKFRTLLSFPANGSVGWVRGRGVPDLFHSYRFLRNLLERDRMDAVAGGLQKFTEEMLTGWARRCIARTGVRKVALGGGVFMNVKANQAIAALPEVEDIFIFPSCGDESNAFGAAYAAYTDNRSSRDPPIEPLGPLYLGPRARDGEVERLLATGASGLVVRRMADPAVEVAELLARGEIVARFRGRTEFGARALGNRSILADPERVEGVRTINEMIKSRDFWMPFALTINREHEGEYVLNPKGLMAPYMMITFPTTAAVGKIRAGTHPYDDTVRPQILDEVWNPEYHRLIDAFRTRTGKGAVLNTSFNLHGSPIVNTPADALDVFRRSGLKYLALEEYLVGKP